MDEFYYTISVNDLCKAKSEINQGAGSLEKEITPCICCSDFSIEFLSFALPNVTPLANLAPQFFSEKKGKNKIKDF